MKYAYFIHDSHDGTSREATFDEVLSALGSIMMAVLISSGSISSGTTIYEYRKA